MSGVDDAHIKAGLDGVVEEGSVHGFADSGVSAKREGDIADAAADFGAREEAFELAGGLDKGDGVGVVLFDTGGDGEDVGVKDDIFFGEADFLGEDLVSAAKDLDTALGVGGLAVFIKGHDHDSSAIASDFTGLCFEDFFAFFEADGVDDGLSLEDFESGLKDFKLGAIDHDGDTGDIGFRRHEVEKARHGGDRVDQAFVHVDVDDVGSAVDLLAGDGEGGFIIASFDQVFEAFGARDVGAFADHQEVGVLSDAKGFEAAVAALVVRKGRDAGRERGYGLGDGGDVGGGSATTSACEVEPTFGGESPHHLGHVFGSVVIFAEFVGESGVGIADGGEVGEMGEFFDVGPHLVDAECAVDSDGSEGGVRDGGPKGFEILAGESASRVVGDGDGGDHGDAMAALFKDLFDGIEFGFEVEGVDVGFE